MKVGIILQSLSANQLAYMALHQVNRLAHTTQHDFVFFIEEITIPVIEPKTAVMSIVEIHGFDGLLIASNLQNAELASRTINNSRKLFYINELEPLRGQTNFTENLKVYRNPQLTLIARSESHADWVENYCNRRPEVIADFNLLQMMETYGQTK